MRATAFFLLVCCAAAGLCLDDPRLQTEVKGTFGCLPLCELLPKLGEPATVRLSVAPEIKDYLVYLRVNGWPLKVVMEHVAGGLDMKWSHVGTGYLLSPTPSLTARLKKATRAVENEGLDRARARVGKYTQALKIPGAERERFISDWLPKRRYGLDDEDVQGHIYLLLRNRHLRIALRLMSKWTGAEWERMADAGGITYSTSPTKAQSLLEDPGLQQAKAWQRDIREAFHEREPSVVDVLGRPGNDFSPNGLRPQSLSRYDPADVAGMRIRIRLSRSKGLSVLGEVVDKRGRQIVNSYPWSTLAEYRNPPEILDSVQSSGAFAKPFTSPVNYTDFIGQYWELSQAMYRPWLPGHTSDSYVSPLDETVTPILTKIAETRGVSLLVPVSDVVATARVYVASYQHTLADFLNRWDACSKYGLRFTDSGSWIYGKNVDDYYFLLGAHPCPRQILARLYETSRDRKPPSFDELVRQIGPLDEVQCRSLVEGNLVRDIHLPNEVMRCRNELLRFVYRLKPQQRRLIKHGCTVRELRLAPALRKELFSWFVPAPDENATTMDWTQTTPNGLSDAATVKLEVAPGSGYWIAEVYKGQISPQEWIARAASAQELYHASIQPKIRHAAYRAVSWEAALTVTMDRKNAVSRTAIAAFVDPRDPVDPTHPDADLSRIIDAGHKYMRDHGSYFADVPDAR